MAVMSPIICMVSQSVVVLSTNGLEFEVNQPIASNKIWPPPRYARLIPELNRPNLGMLSAIIPATACSANKRGIRATNVIPTKTHVAVRMSMKRSGRIKTICKMVPRRIQLRRRPKGRFTNRSTGCAQTSLRKNGIFSSITASAISLIGSWNSLFATVPIQSPTNAYGSISPR